MPNADLDSSQVRAVMNTASTVLNSFTEADWYDLAAACLDQAGFTVRDQKLFASKFERPEDK